MSEVSVIVATVGRPERLERLLAALAAQDLPCERFEVVVAIDGSDPQTVSLLEQWAPRFARLTWIETERRHGPATARNRAWRAARSTLIAMTDDDCEPSSGWLSAFVDRFRLSPETGVLFGRTITDRSVLTPFSHYVENLDGSGHQTCNAAYRRQILERLHGFDERFPMAYLEDTDLFCRASGITQVEFVPAAVVVHPPREARVRDIARSARKYRCDFLFFQKSPDLYRNRHQGHGPTMAVLWFVGIKHTIKQVWAQRSWLKRDPWCYCRYLLALSLFELVLWTGVPKYWWRHRKADGRAAAPADVTRVATCD